MPENPYNSLFWNDDWTNKEENIDNTKDDFGEDRLKNPDIPKVWDVIENSDWTTEKVVNVESEILLWYWKCLDCYAESDWNQKQCSHCWKDRPLNVEFYLKEDSPVITDNNKIDEALSWPDWQCTVCSTINAFNDRLCSDCWTDQNLWWDEEKSLNAVYNDSWVEERDDILENREDVLPKEQEQRDKVAEILKKVPGGKKVRNVVWWVMITILTIFWGNEVRLRYTTHTEDAKVESMEWERKINIEKLVPVNEDSRNTYPSDAYNVNQQRKIHHYDKVEIWKEPYQDTDYRYEKTWTKTVQKSERVKTWIKPKQYTTTEYETEYYTDTEYETRSLWNWKFERVAVTKQKSRRVPKTVTKTEYEDVYETRYYDVQEDIYENVPYQVTKYRPIYEDVPNWQIHYTYIIDKWIDSRPVGISWNDNNPRRPDDSEILLRDNERKWDAFEDYDICFITEDGKKWCLDVSESEFRLFRDWQDSKVLVNWKGEITDIDDSNE